MAVSNSLANRNNSRQGITQFLSGQAVRDQIDRALGSTNSQRFITSVVSAVNANPGLAKCSNKSIFSGALLGESLNLSPSPQLGQFYLVPYKNNSAGTYEAQFQMGYKGYIQLAIRSGQYKKLNVMAVKEGELQYFDPLNEEIKINLMVDRWDEREKAETIGYYAMFELVNGFKKAIYWSKKQMEEHAKRYSPGYAADVKKGTAYTFWSKNFDQMAYKTMLRQLISKWGIMSLDMQSAFSRDFTVEDESGVKYAETDVDPIDMDAPAEASLDESGRESELQDAQENHGVNSAAEALFS